MPDLPVPRSTRLLALTFLALAAAPLHAQVTPCTTDAACEPGERCHGEESCATNDGAQIKDGLP